MRLTKISRLTLCVVVALLICDAAAQGRANEWITFDPMAGRSVSAQYVAGGPYDAARLHASCVGYINYTRPDHVLEVTHDAMLEVSVRSTQDTTLVILRDGAVAFCNDDGPVGFDPVVVGRFLAGIYHIYVGTYRDVVQYPEYTLMIQSR